MDDGGVCCLMSSVLRCQHALTLLQHSTIAQSLLLCQDTDVAWKVAPSLMLALIALPSFALLEAGVLAKALAEALAPCAADKSLKGQSLSSYSALMAEYRNRMGMDRESRSSSLSILAENPSVEPCHCQPLPMFHGTSSVCPWIAVCS